MARSPSHFRSSFLESCMQPAALAVAASGGHDVLGLTLLQFSSDSGLGSWTHVGVHFGLHRSLTAIYEIDCNVLRSLFGLLEWVLPAVCDSDGTFRVLPWYEFSHPRAG